MEQEHQDWDMPDRERKLPANGIAYRIANSNYCVLNITDLVAMFTRPSELDTALHTTDKPGKRHNTLSCTPSSATCSRAATRRETRPRIAASPEEVFYNNNNIGQEKGRNTILQCRSITVFYNNNNNKNGKEKGRNTILQCRSITVRFRG
uniref:Uncharacterized protein n=1 Tax=Anopheles coluzzii TaxID=1518534 RepID=A0A8W7Q2Q4_ANOCL